MQLTFVITDLVVWELALQGDVYRYSYYRPQRELWCEHQVRSLAGLP